MVGMRIGGGKDGELIVATAMAHSRDMSPAAVKQYRIRINRVRRSERRPFAFPKGTFVRFQGYLEGPPRLFIDKVYAKSCRGLLRDIIEWARATI